MSVYQEKNREQGRYQKTEREMEKKRTFESESRKESYD